MSVSDSVGVPLQAYNSVKSESGSRSKGDGDDKSHDQPQPSILRLIPVLKNGIRPPRTYEDVEFRLLRSVGKDHIPIIQSSEIELNMSNWTGDSISRSGFSMQVYKGRWRKTGQAVALKRFKTYFYDKSDKSAMHKYGQAMEDLFEMQILSKPSLRQHRNIVTLFGITFSDDDSSEGQISIPILVVELAHLQYPDLSLFFDRKNNPGLPERIPFEISTSLIADIADGIAALHKHDLIHADLKPANILLFPDDNSPNGLIAKISDFGFSGMTTYNWRMVRAPLFENVPRGSTKEWNAPECIIKRPEDTPYNFDKNPANKASRDIYSFGLVVCFIALNGQYPRNFIENLDEAKLTDNMVEVAKSLLSTYYESFANLSLVEKFLHIAERTLRLRPEDRLENLDSIRELLFDGQSHYEHPEAKVFVLNFNLLPGTVHELKCGGLYDAYWASPPPFRRRAYDFFKSSYYGIVRPPVEFAIFKELEEKADD